MSFINIIKSKIKIKSSKNNEPIFYQRKGLMKKLISSIIIGVFFAMSSYAEDKNRLEALPGVWWEHIPAICVENTTLQEYADKKELQPLNRSFGREGGKPDGVIVYIVTYWVNIHNDQSMASVMVPNSKYSCVLYRTFDMQLNPYFDFNLKTDV